MLITFKEVGQGDSIILEWDVEGVKKIGVIDCNRKGKLNPVVEHLRSSNYSEIEFIILSHPHTDHYSGMFELFEYAEQKGLIIQKFAHSLHLIGTQYWLWFESDTEDAKILERVLKKSESLYENGNIKKIGLITEDWEIDLSSNISLKCVSPSNEEVRAYQNLVAFAPGVKKKEASKGANLLSTVFRLMINEHAVLLTSDAEAITLRRLHSTDRGVVFAQNFCLCQIPHHGSEKNYHNEFWSELLKSTSYIAIISAGENEKYHHPDYSVIEQLHTLGFTIHSTNIVNGMQEYVQKLRDKILMLDSFSSLIEDYTINKDRTFKF